ncbi:MAG TPA: SRPBCC family protein [Bdellovibrionota bacterium]|nr:SRPBCC family protein [Bdellovibrionota bacterium]
MAQAEITETLAVDKDKLLATIVKYEDYPRFVEGCTSVKVERPSPNEARVTYLVNMMKEITYTLDQKADPAKGVIEWSLVSSDFMKVNNGRWELRSVGPGKTEAKYRIEIEFKFPVPSMILNRLIKGSLPSMVRSFEKQAKANG